MLKDIKELNEMIDNRARALNISILLLEFIRKFGSLLTIRIHPLGFYVVQLGYVSKQIQLRLHLWEPHLTNDQSNLLIHNHNFNMTSLVLVGNILNKTYEVVSEKSINGSLYKVEYSGNKSFLEIDSKNVNLKPYLDETIAQGSYYTLRSEKFHTSIACSKSNVITLMQRVHVSDVAPLVFGSSNSKDGEKLQFEREKVTNEEVLRKIEQLIVNTYHLT